MNHPLHNGMGKRVEVDGDYIGIVTSAQYDMSRYDGTARINLEVQDVPMAGGHTLPPGSTHYRDPRTGEVHAVERAARIVREMPADNAEWLERELSS
jgi:hypothetical protein